MAKLQLGAGFDAAGLDEAEYDDSFEPYRGPLPPDNSVFQFRLVRAFSCAASDGSFMIKAILVAEKAGKYEGLTVVDQVVFRPDIAFRYQPFMHAMGLTAKLIKSKTIVADDEDEKWGGPQIISVGSWKPGSDEARCTCRVYVDYDYDPQNPRAKISKYWALDDDDVPDISVNPVPAAQARSSKPAKPAEDDESLFEDDKPPF